MGKATRKAVAVLATAAASLSFGAAVAAADPAPAGEHQITYTLSGGDAQYTLYYLATQPPSKAAYDADPYQFLKKETINLAGAPWVFETTMTDPSWAILTVSSTTHGGRAAPNPHCEIAVDGNSAVQQDAPYNLSCQLKDWMAPAAP